MVICNGFIHDFWLPFKASRSQRGKDKVRHIGLQSMLLPCQELHSALISRCMSFKVHNFILRVQSAMVIQKALVVRGMNAWWLAILERSHVVCSQEKVFESGKCHNNMSGLF
jgi:hypothetical protein